MVFLVPRMQLQDELARAVYPVISIAMRMIRKRVGSQQLAVPATARPHIVHGNQGLGTDGRFHVLRSFRSFAAILTQHKVGSGGMASGHDFSRADPACIAIGL
jgi:hypothetical protein